MKYKSSSYLLIFIALLLGVGLACGGATAEVQEASETDAEADGDGEEVAQEEPSPTEEQAESTAIPPTSTEIPVTETPESTPTPTQPPATPTPEPESLRLIDQGFGQDDTVVGYSFLVENPNEGLAIESAQYQVTLYDADGGIVETDSGRMAVILPGQTLGVGSDMYLDEGLTADTIEVRLSGGNAVATESLPSFAVSNVAFYPGDFSNSVTAIVESPYNRDFSDVRVSAVLYNEADEIVGGGFTFMNFIPAESSTGLEMSVRGSDAVARAEIYPVLSNLSLMRQQETPEDAAAPLLHNSGFGQDGIHAGYGILLENPNDNYMIEFLMFRVTAYAADGAVLGTDDGYAPTLLPGQTLGIGGDLFLATEQPIDRLEAQISGGDFLEPDPELMAFTTEEAAFQQGSFSSHVTGFVVNPYDQDVTDLRLSALAYNEADEIIGGGFTFLDFASASDRTAAEVSVITAGPPARVELYATLSNLSDFQ